MQQTAVASEADLNSTRAILDAYPEHWWIAGGWAIDLHIHASRRPHHDVDIAVMRWHQHELQHYLSGWRLQKVVDGKRIPWLTGERLRVSISMSSKRMNTGMRV